MAVKPDIVITGFLGTGKSALAEHLRNELAGPEAPSVMEVPGLRTCHPELSQCPPWGGIVLATVDAANLETMIADEVTGGLVAAQIASADAIVLTRSDIVEPDTAWAILAGLSDAPVLVAPFGRIDPGALPEAQGRAAPQVDLTAEFTEWSYRGPAMLSAEQAEVFLEKRSRGVYRIRGHALTAQGGLDLQLSGRVRQIAPIDAPDETCLTALGPKVRFRRSDMDVLFSECAAASAQRAGIFSWR